MIHPFSFCAGLAFGETPVMAPLSTELSQRPSQVGNVTHGVRAPNRRRHSSLAFCAGLALAWCGGTAEAGTLQDPRSNSGGGGGAIFNTPPDDERFCVQQNDKCELIGGGICRNGEGLTRKQIMQCKPVDAAKVEVDELKARIEKMEKRLDRIENWAGCRQRVGPMTPC